MDDKSLEDGSEQEWKYTPGSDDGYSGGGVSDGIYDESNQESVSSVSWTASEYIAHEKGANWYLMLGLASFVLVIIVFVLTRDIFASVAVAIACLLLGIYSGRKPQTISYVLDRSGILVGEKLHSFAAFKSFSVVEEGMINSIWLKPLKRFAPLVVMYFPPDQGDEIVDVLSNYLPHEDRELDAIDRASKRMRF